MSKRRALSLVALVALLWSFVGASLVSADTIGGAWRTDCDDTPFVAWQGSVDGYAEVRIQFRLGIPVQAEDPQTVVVGRWQLSNGAMGYQYAWQGPYDQWVSPATTGGSNSSLIARFNPGSTGTARYVIQRPADYGGCFTVTHTVVERVPFQAGGGVPPDANGGGFATPSPTPTGAPTPAPTPTAPPCSADGVVEPGCEPPEGYCWGYGPPGPGEEWPVFECESASPSPSPTPSPTPGAVHWQCQHDDSPRSCTDSFTYNIPAGAVVSVEWSIEATGFDGNLPNRSTRISLHGPAGAYGVSTTGETNQLCKSGGTSGVNGTPCSGVDGDFTGLNPVGAGAAGLFTMSCGEPDWYYTTTCTAIPTVTLNGEPLGPDGSPIPSATPTPTPSPSGPTPTPTLPAGWATPSPATGYPDPGGDGWTAGPLVDVDGEDGTDILPAQGSGIGNGGPACEGAERTPLTAKVGYVPPGPVKTSPSLGDWIAIQGGAFIPPLNVIMGAFSWVGGHIGATVDNTLGQVLWLWNQGVDAVVPGPCIGEVVATSFDDLMLIEPFATYTVIEAQVTAAMAGAAGDPAEWCVPLWDGAGEVCLPLGEWAAVIAPARNVSAVFVWLMGALGALAIITGSFRVVRAGVSGRSDATARLP